MKIPVVWHALLSGGGTGRTAQIGGSKEGSALEALKLFTQAKESPRSD